MGVDLTSSIWALIQYFYSVIKPWVSELSPFGSIYTRAVLVKIGVTWMR